MDRIRSRCHRERDRQLMSRPCLRQFVPAERELRLTSPRSETPQGKARAGVLYGPKAKTPHREKSVGPRSPNIDLFLPDGYRAVPEWEAARAFRALDVVPVDLHPLPLGWKGSFAFRPASHQEDRKLPLQQTNLRRRLGTSSFRVSWYVLMTVAFGEDTSARRLTTRDSTEGSVSAESVVRILHEDPRACSLSRSGQTRRKIATAKLCAQPAP